MMLILYVLIVTVISQVLCNHSYEEKEKRLNKIIYNLDDAKDLFESFVKKYDKKYASKTDFLKRLQIFEDSLERINKLNLEYDSTTFGITQFSDMTYEEVSKCYMGVSNISNVSNDDVVKYTPTGFAPEELDYRTQGLVTGVKSQQTCGACFAFSAIANIESQYAKKYGQLVSLSEQQGLDCEPTGSCDRGGQVHNVMQALAGQGGSMKNEDYPYENAKGACRTDRNKIVVRVTGGNQIGVNEDGLADALANYGPISVYINTCQEFKFYVSGIFKTSNCAGTLHAVLLVGYGTADGEPYWIIKNSWGTDWGEQGYVRLRRGMGVCNIGSYAATATVA